MRQPAAEQIDEQPDRQHHIVVLQHRQRLITDRQRRQTADAVCAAGVFLLVGKKQFDQRGQRQGDNVEEHAFDLAGENEIAEQSCHQPRNQHAEQHGNRRIVQDLHEPGNLGHAKAAHEGRHTVAGRIRQRQHIAAQSEEHRLPQIHQAGRAPENIQRQGKNNIDDAFAHHLNPE